MFFASGNRKFLRDPKRNACGGRRGGALLTVVVALPALCHAGDEFQPLEIQRAPALAVGKTAPTLLAKTAQGKSVSLVEGKAKWTVVAFLSTECACTARYLTRLQEIEKQFAPRSVRILGVNANANESPEDVARYAKVQKLSFPLLKDSDSSVARALRPQSTPEIFILDARRVVRYHGPIDDSLYGDDIKQFYLKDALTALTTGKPLAKPDVKPFGCAIFVPKKRSVSTPGSVPKPSP